MIENHIANRLSCNCEKNLIILGKKYKFHIAYSLDIYRVYLNYNTESVQVEAYPNNISNVIKLDISRNQNPFDIPRLLSKIQLYRTFQWSCIPNSYNISQFITTNQYIRSVKMNSKSRPLCSNAKHATSNSSALMISYSLISQTHRFNVGSDQNYY